MEQVDVAAKKIDASLRQAGLSIADVVKYKMYVKKGADPEAVRARFHQAVAKLAGGKRPDSAETLVVVEGLAGPALQFEVTAIAAGRRD
jgi:enamine deaminase RidA (YjgF/YER057c/UK114 family)